MLRGVCNKGLGVDQVTCVTESPMLQLYRVRLSLLCYSCNVFDLSSESVLKSFNGRSWFLYLSWARSGFPRENIMSPFVFP